VWLRLQKPRLRFTLEDAAHAVRQRVREHLASRRSAAAADTAGDASERDS